MCTIICSDCHGRPELIQNVIDDSGYDKNADRLIFAGDIFDIGPDPSACMQLLLRLNAEVLWGNHDVAAYFGLRISPQSRYDDSAYEQLRKMSPSMKAATTVNDILITHAGVGEIFYSKFFDCEVGAEKIQNCINSTTWEILWDNCGPLWYRPNAYDRLIPFVRQVFGHTPRKEYSVDPWIPEGYNSMNRYRYAVVEDGKIEIRDSKSNERKS